jgi:hypothetical protein
MSGNARLIGRRGVGTGSMGSMQGAQGLVGRLDRWVQVMDLWSITLGDE